MKLRMSKVAAAASFAFVVVIGTGVVTLVLRSDSEAERVTTASRSMSRAAAGRATPAATLTPALETSRGESQIAPGASRQEPASREESVSVQAEETTPGSAAPVPATRPAAPCSFAAALDAVRKTAASEDGVADESVDQLRVALETASGADVARLLAEVRTLEDRATLEAIGQALDPHGLERPEVRTALADMAVNDTNEGRRAFAVASLSAAPIDDEVVNVLGRAARADSSPEVREAATSALASAIEQDPTRATKLDAQLADVATQDAEQSVRWAALWAIQGHDADGATIDKLSSVLSREADPAGRQAAAEVLGDANPENRARALASLTSALGAEQDLDVRKAELGAIVRAGRAESIPVLEAIAKAHPELATDAAEWLVELKKGELDMENLWRAKQHAEDARTGASLATSAPGLQAPGADEGLDGR